MPCAEDIGYNQTRRHSVKCGSTSDCRVNADPDSVVDLGFQLIYRGNLWLSWRVRMTTLLLQARRIIPMGNRW